MTGSHYRRMRPACSLHTLAYRRMQAAYGRNTSDVQACIWKKIRAALGDNEIDMQSACSLHAA